MKTKIILGIILVILIIGGIIAYNKYDYWINNQLAYSAICPTKVDSLQRIDIIRKSQINPNDYLSVSTYSRDGLLLKGYFIKAKTDTAKATIILLHGIGSCKESMMEAAKTIAEKGYNCAMFDQRAQGESDGKYCTFGYYEKYDMLDIINYLRSELIGNTKIGLYGHSLGGAIVIQTMAIDTSISGGIAASAFGNMRDVIRDYSESELGVRLDFIPDNALSAGEKIANYTVDSVSPVNSAKLIDKPVYIIHGNEDPKIRVYNAYKIYDALKTKNKKIFIIAKAHHEDLQQYAGTYFWESIVQFFDDNLKK